ncbi:MAG TPA: hypothetical protein VK210_12015 [Terriglobia bacterium]|nr:hypothetical protein [Terriglobia bacterium]
MKIVDLLGLNRGGFYGPSVASSNQVKTPSIVLVALFTTPEVNIVDPARRVRRMNSRKLNILWLMIGLCALLLIHPAVSVAQEVKLEGASLQEVLDRLFGTPTTPGLLQGDKAFELRAQDLVLTGAQADLFFAPSTTNKSDLSDLIAAAELIKGSQLRLEGTVDGTPFDLKLAGKEVKADGLVLTQAEFDALVDQLKTTSGLKEVKIEATVDGRLVELKMENTPGRVSIEDKGLPKHDARIRDTNRGTDSKRDHDEGRLEAANHANRPERAERIERVEKVERPEAVEHVERVERLERPELEHGGSGRH